MPCIDPTSVCLLLIANVSAPIRACGVAVFVLVRDDELLLDLEAFLGVILWAPASQHRRVIVH